jgi:flagella basal body P-ring formation protein FlgA
MRGLKLLVSGILLVLPAIVAAGPVDKPAAKPVKAGLAPQPAAAASQPVTSDQIRSAIARYLERQQSGHSMEFEVSLLMPEEGLSVPAGPLELAVNSVRGEELVGRRAFQVAVLVRGREVHTLRVMAQVEAQADVAVASRYIKPDETIAAEDVSVSHLQLPPGAADFVFDVQQVIGKRPLRPLLAEKPIRASSLAQAFTVRKGDRVTIEARRGGLIIHAVGVTKASALLGQLVTVTNQDSGKDLRAKVIGPGTVQVDF